MTTLACHFRVHTHGYKVFVGGSTFEVDGGRVFSEGAVGCKVVCRSQLPHSIIAKEAEVSGVIVEIANIVVENNPAELMLYSFRRLSQKPS